MKLIKTEKKKVPNCSLSFCENTFKEIYSDKLQRADSKECVKLDREAYVYIEFACDDTGVHENDRIAVGNVSECEIHPDANKVRVKKELKNIKPGMSESQLLKMGFRVIDQFTKMKDGSLDPWIWTFHSFPGVNVQIRMRNNCKKYFFGASCWRNDSTVKEVLSVTERFESKRECELWGGKPILEDNVFPPIRIKACEFANKPEFTVTDENFFNKHQKKVKD